jgi:hypothetical protein
MLLTFFASPKKVSKKRRPQASPFGFPIVQYKKWEMAETRYARTTAISDPFSVPHNRRGSKRLKVKVKNNDNQILQY